MKFGRLPHDPVKLAQAASLANHPLALTAPRPVVDRRSIHFEPGLYKNDILPDCTCAALANAASAVAALNGYQLAIDPNGVTRFYARCVGCADNLDEMAKTEGDTCLDVLDKQARHGFDVLSQGRLVGLHGVLPLTRTAIANSIDKLGHAYFGIVVYQRDMDNVGGKWDDDGKQDNGAVAGGHALTGWDYTGLADTDTLRLCTWGLFQTTTWRWLFARIQEAHALIWRQLATASSGQDLGVDVATLESDLKQMSA